MNAQSPIEAGRAAAQQGQGRSGCPYDLDSPSIAERRSALAWLRAWSDANPMPTWDDDADPGTDPPTEGEGSAAWRRARTVEEYVRRRYGAEIQVSACCRPGDGTASALVIGRGRRVVFLERTGRRGWGYTTDPDVARAIDAWTTTADTMTAAVARAVELSYPEGLGLPAAEVRRAATRRCGGAAAGI